MSDLIDRQAAIDAIEAEKIKHGNYLTSSYVGYEMAEKVVKQLPSAQPEPSWDCEKCMMEHTDEMEKLETELAIAKSKQPEQCDDAVSRQEIIDRLNRVISLGFATENGAHPIHAETVLEVVKELPSVTPKQRTGKWIKLDMHRGMADHKCTACEQECYVPTCMGEPMYAFCPNCGAKMEVTE